MNKKIKILPFLMISEDFLNIHPLWTGTI